MSTCRDCRYWLKQDMPKRNDFGVCVYTMASHGSPVIIHAKAFARDVDGFGAQMMTSQEFGCNQFEERPREEQFEKQNEGRNWY